MIIISKTLNFHFTDYCNFKCNHCFVNLEDQNLTLDQCKNIIDKVKTKNEFNRINLADGVTVPSYGGNLNSILRDADEDPNNNMLVNIIYEDETMRKDQNGSGGPNEWNKEHMVPQSWGVSDAGLKGDLHNLRISRASTNSTRGNLSYAVGSGAWGTVSGGFWPGEGYQADAARIVMYMMLRLPNTITAQKAIAGDSYNLLAKWHYEDPVDAFEIRRNNILYEAQGNRNPFIDHPVFFDLIFFGGVK